MTDKKEILAKHMANWMVQGKTPGSKHHLEAMDEYAEEYAKAFCQFQSHYVIPDSILEKRMAEFKESLKK